MNPSQLTYIEAHGTGTKVGDTEECKAIDKAICRKRKDPLLIGSIKSNVGHSEPGSGICSLVKVIFRMFGTLDSSILEIFYLLGYYCFEYWSYST